MTLGNNTARDKRVDEIIGVLLRSGVILAAAVVCAGGAFYLARYGFAEQSYRVFHGEPQGLTHVGGIVREALALNPGGIIQLGLLILIATPIARVAFTIFAFAWERDWVYVVVTVVVLTLLLYSLGASHL